jgi:hypothetical protein
MNMMHYSLVTFHIDDDKQRAWALALLLSSGVPDGNIVSGIGKTLLVYIEHDNARTLLLDTVALRGLFASEIIAIDIDQDGLPNVRVSTEHDVIPSPF